ncbi:MAG TPA: hypothetical protein VIY27_03055 [Myxococcota bacterium]
MSPKREDESASNLLEGLPGGPKPPIHVTPAYTVVLLACGAAALSWRLFATQLDPSILPFVDAIFALGCACWFAAFLRAIRSPSAPIATLVVSIVLAFWFPLGTLAFLYWMFRVRPREPRSAPT